MKNEKVLTPHEAEVDKLLQIMAVLIDKLGGEVVLNRQELEAFFDAKVTTRVLSGDYALLRLSYPEEMVIIESPSTPEGSPQQ